MASPIEVALGVALLVTNTEGSDEVVTVLPVTPTPPKYPALALEIPPATKARLGLDEERSWVVLTEENRFLAPISVLRLAVMPPQWPMASCRLNSTPNSLNAF